MKGVKKGTVMLVLALSMLCVTRNTGLGEVAGSQCPLLIPALSSHIVCYPPSDKRIAQRLFWSHQLDPSSLVKGLTGEALTQLVTIQRYNEAGHLQRKAWRLDYEFGPAPIEFPATPTPMPSSTSVTPQTQATWTEVVEFAPHPQFRRFKGMHIARLDDPYYGEIWQLQEVLRVHHNLLLQINTNGDQVTLVSTGRALMKKDRQG